MSSFLWPSLLRVHEVGASAQLGLAELSLRKARAALAASCLNAILAAE